MGWRRNRSAAAQPRPAACLLTQSTGGRGRATKPACAALMWLSPACKGVRRRAGGRAVEARSRVETSARLRRRRAAGGSWLERQSLPRATDQQRDSLGHIGSADGAEMAARGCFRVRVLAPLAPVPCTPDPPALALHSVWSLATTACGRAASVRLCIERLGCRAVALRLGACTVRQHKYVDSARRPCKRRWSRNAHGWMTNTFQDAHLTSPLPQSHLSATRRLQAASHALQAGALRGQTRPPPPTVLPHSRRSAPCSRQPDSHHASSSPSTESRIVRAEQPPCLNAWAGNSRERLPNRRCSAATPSRRRHACSASQPCTSPAERAETGPAKN